MSKKDKIERRPVPEEPVQGYSMMVYLLAVQLGIEKNAPEVFHYVEMLVDACARHTFEQTHKISPKRRMEKTKRQFIEIFKNRYLQLTDFEYDRPITGVDAKMIKQLTQKLEAKGFTADDYLRWIFEAFLPDNDKFCPPALKWTCSAFALESFFYANRHKVKEIHEQEIHRKEGLAIINRARALMRQASEDGKEAEKEKIKKIMLDYRDKHIMLGEFRKKIEEMERQNRQMSQKESTDG